MLPSGYPAALLLTLVVEVPLYAVALRAGWGLPWRRGVAAAILVNLVTHPLLWFGLAALHERPGYPLVLTGAELAVCLVEWALLAAALVPHDRLALAVVCVGVNAASVLAGLVLTEVLLAGALPAAG